MVNIMTAVVICKVVCDTSHFLQLNFTTFNGLAVFTECMFVQYIVYVSSVPALIDFSSMNSTVIPYSISVTLASSRLSASLIYTLEPDVRQLSVDLSCEHVNVFLVHFRREPPHQRH